MAETGEAVTPEVTKLTGDIWNRMTPIEREQLGVKAGLDAGERGSRWIELWPEKKRALIREFTKEQVAIPRAKTGNPGFTAGEAVNIGRDLGIDFTEYDVEQFRQGLNVELEHCNVTGCDPVLTGKIAQAHLEELPDYYTRLAKMEVPRMERWFEKELADKRAMEEARPVPRTEQQRKTTHERIFGKGTLPPLERLGKGQTVNNLLPMPPTEGPPLPRAFAIRWPWKK